jgi:hypothetical protein
MKNRSRKLLVSATVVAALLLAIASVWKQFQSRVPLGPKASVTHTLHDFGNLVTGNGMVNYTFLLSNRGSATLDPTTLNTGCNCLGLKYPPKVEPGETVPVRFDLELRSREGHFATGATLGTNDPQSPRIELRVQFYGIPVTKAEPAELRLRDLLPDDVVVREFDILAADPQTRDLVPQLGGPLPPWIECYHVGSKAEAETFSFVDRMRHTYRVTFDASRFPKGGASNVSSELVLLGHDGGQQVKLTVPIDISFRHHPRLGGSTTVLVQRSHAGGVTRATVWSLDKRPWTIERLESSISDLVLSSEDSPAPHLRMILVSHPAPVESLIRGEVRVFTAEDPDHPFRIAVVVPP